MSSSLQWSISSFLNEQHFDLNDLRRALGFNDTVKIKGWMSGNDAPALLDPGTLERFASFFGVDPALLLEVYLPLEVIQSRWSTAHGEVLLGLLAERGLTTNTADIPGVDKTALWRWSTARFAPRPRSMRRFLEHLRVSPDVFMEVEGNGRATNRFAEALAEVFELWSNPDKVEDLNLALRLSWDLNGKKGTHRQFAELLSVDYRDLCQWMRGSSLPTGAAEARMDEVMGFTVASVRSEQQATAELSANVADRTFGVSNLCRFLYEERRSRGLTRAAAADLIGVSTSALHSWEMGTIVPYKSSLRQVADTYRVGYEEMSWVAFGVPDVESETFGQRLRRLRHRALLSTHEVAAGVGMNPFVYRRYESGKAFPGYSLQRLTLFAEVLGVSVEELLGSDVRTSGFSRWLGDTLFVSSLTSDDLALMLGVDTSVVDDWVEGTSLPGVHLVPGLRQALGVTSSVVRSHLLA